MRIVFSVLPARRRADDKTLGVKWGISEINDRYGNKAAWKQGLKYPDSHRRAPESSDIR